MKQRHRGKAARRRATRRRRRLMTAAAFALALVIIALGAYIVLWYANLGRVNADGSRYRQMYSGRATDVPGTAAAVPTAAPTPVLTAKPTAVPAAKPTPVPTAEPTPEATTMRIAIPVPTPTAETRIAIPVPTPTAGTRIAIPTPTPEPTDAPLPTERPMPTARRFAVPARTAEPAVPPTQMPVAVDAPIPTPGRGTLVMALPTPPPVQESFSELLAHNADTVGFLDADGVIALPVVQRENDNAYYLDHNFDREQASEGALFMDGLNRLVPEDDCLIVYGHNMKNDTMFGRLSAFGDVDFLKQHSIVRFDTIYEDRSYVPFAAFSASMTPGDRRYFDVRKFIFDETEFDKFVLKLRGRSAYTVPVDVAYGDRLLLLVTCDYANRDGRFILALRQLRPGESEANMWARVVQSTAK